MRKEVRQGIYDTVLLFTASAVFALVGATLLNAGSTGYATGQSCTVTADVVSCTPDANRGSLVIEADNAQFTKLRDALTPEWDGTYRCTSCAVASGFTGCNVVGDEVATTRKKAALTELICTLRSWVVEEDERVAVDAAEQGVDKNPDIGGGDPQ